jgi:hypothetical protein
MVLHGDRAQTLSHSTWLQILSLLLHEPQLVQKQVTQSKRSLKTLRKELVMEVLSKQQGIMRQPGLGWHKGMRKAKEAW